jgi:hypothetical protein
MKIDARCNTGKQFAQDLKDGAIQFEPGRGTFYKRTTDQEYGFTNRDRLVCSGGYLGDYCVYDEDYKFFLAACPLPEGEELDRTRTLTKRDVLAKSTWAELAEDVAYAAALGLGASVGVQAVKGVESFSGAATDISVPHIARGRRLGAATAGPYNMVPLQGNAVGPGMAIPVGPGVAIAVPGAAYPADGRSVDVGPNVSIAIPGPVAARPSLRRAPTPELPGRSIPVGPNFAIAVPPTAPPRIHGAGPLGPGPLEPPDPIVFGPGEGPNAAQKGIRGAKDQALVGAGGIIGASVGSIFGPVGVAIGGMIGASVGAGIAASLDE